MPVTLLLDLLPYWNSTNIGITPVLDDIFFWNFLDTFFGLWYTSSKYFWFSCMFVNLLVGLLPYRNKTNIGISPVFDELSFWNFLDTFLRCLYTFFDFLQIVRMSVSPIFGLQTYWKWANMGIHPVLDEISFWNFWGTFLGYFDTISK